MRKSSVTSRSSFPSGASSCQTTSFGFFAPVSPRSLPMHAVRRAEQVLEEILVPLAGGAEQVRAPDEHVARPVLRMRPGPRRTSSSSPDFSALRDVVLRPPCPAAAAALATIAAGWS